jgi:alpha-glucosidase
MQFFAQVGERTFEDGTVVLPLQHGFALRIEALEPWCLRVALLPPDGLRIDRSWMVAPEGDTPPDGRDRLGREGFGCPPVSPGDADDDLLVGDFRLRIQRAPLALTIQTLVDGRWHPVLSDRPTGAYALARQGRQTRHYQCRSRQAHHYGLGDKTGPLDRSGRRFRCLQLDALGYDAERSDPLYKHAPFLIVDEPAQDGAAGLLYDTLSEITFDLGAEHSNYHPAYRYAEVEEPGLVYYVLAGPRVRDVVTRLYALTGRPYFPPRWSFGFAFTSMHHADDPHAQAVIEAFARRCRADAMPISAIHSGSGYTLGEDGNRYVFTWNERAFPDRNALFTTLRSLGFHTAANVKPTLLTTHPAYADAAAAGRFVMRANGAPAVERFWGGLGSSLDFTNPATVRWWQEQATSQVLEAGFDAIWNDNNEAEIADEDAWLHGFGTPLPAIDLRPLLALLMTRASVEATRAHAPDRRHYSITRAGPIGIQRYAETWSGDNRTSWHTLKWNLRNGLSMSLSGMPLVGHDVGGFDGPRPGPELLVRWVQMMALHPRCVMNAWKPGPEGGPNLPWMHPDVTDLVREALRLRYRFLPLLYNLARHAHLTGEPIIAPLFYHFDDRACRAEWDAFMVGRDVLVAPVVAPDVRSVEVYLPAVAGGWHSFATGDLYPGDQVVTLPAPLERLPILVRDGALLPLADEWPANAPHDPTRVGLTLYAGPDFSSGEGHFYWDDGLTVAGSEAAVHVTAHRMEGEVEMAMEKTGRLELLPEIRLRTVTPSAGLGT